MTTFSRLGLFLIVLGAVSLVLFFATPVNPNVTLADLGLLSILGGVLFIYLGFLRRRTAPEEQAGSLVVTGWKVLSVGLLVALGAFLLLNQTMCAEACDLTGYYAYFYGGLLAAAAGLAMIIVGRGSRH
jgi:uncharacterized membrane protein YidH (DUF202 family)